MTSRPAPPSESPRRSSDKERYSQQHAQLGIRFVKVRELPIIRRLTPFARHVVSVIATAWLAFGTPIASGADDVPTGAAIYKEKCARCHGPNGEGTLESFPRPLEGDRSISGLAKLIAKTMPEDAPGECVGDDAERVAEFVYNAFYSKTARSKNKPPRIELARLTARRQRNAVADLIGSFRPMPSSDARRGLEANLRARGGRGGGGGGRRRNVAPPAINRIDPVVDFHFGATNPVAKPLPPELAKRPLARLPVLYVPIDRIYNRAIRDYNLTWQGSVTAPETGVYEFIVESENAIRLWVNDPGKELIDAGVKSGADTVYTASIALLAGRRHLIRLEMRKTTEKTGSVTLKWKPPRGVAEVIPERYLTPAQGPEVYVETAAFPPDDRSVGYERGGSISKAWDQATTDAAIEAAEYVWRHVNELSGAPETGGDRGPKLREFAARFVERAFRRPPSEAEKRAHVDRQFEKSPNEETAIKRVVMLALKSPRFLYLAPASNSDNHAVAERLALILWDGLPDETLRKAADEGKLSDTAELMRQAERMLADDRARAKLRDFREQWLGLDRITDLAKDQMLFPEFNEAFVADLKTSLDLFLDDVFDSESADFRKLLTSDDLFINDRLAKYYGVAAGEGAGFRKVKAPERSRAGFLTHPYLMSSLAYVRTSSPIHRGVFVARRILGRTLRPPPEAIAPVAADLHPTLTTRERVALQTKPETCRACHGVINPLGFTFEGFDATGKVRTTDHDQPINTTGSYRGADGETIAYANPTELAADLANRSDVHRAFVRVLFQYMVKQPIAAYGSDALATLSADFEASGCNIRKLAGAIAVRAASYSPEPAGQTAAGGVASQ